MRPETVARFDAYMAKARKLLEEAQETKPHHWEDRALTAERKRDEAREALREIQAAVWKTSGELRGMARKALEAEK